MAVPAGATRCVINGQALNQEIFQTGFWLIDNAPVNQAAATDLATQLVLSAATDLIPQAKTLITNGSSYLGLTVYAYPSGGTQSQYIGQANFASPVVGTASAQMPLQVSMCVTLLTGVAGRTNRGRMFLPANGAPLNLSQFTTTQVDSVCLAVATFIKNWNSAHGAAFGNIGVVSSTRGSSRKMTAVKVDSRPDIQRRRANRFLATYSKTNAAA